MCMSLCLGACLQHGSQSDLALASSSGYTSDDEASTDLPTGMSGIIDGQLSKDGKPLHFLLLARMMLLHAIDVPRLRSFKK